MRKPMRDRRQQRLDRQQKHDELEHQSKSASAAGQMAHRAYESYTVADFLEKIGVDLKGDIGDGQKNIETVSGFEKRD